MPKDGIEIHFDENRGHLELACEPDAFAAYRDLARDHLKDLPEIPVDKVVELNIVDTATIAARRDAPTQRIWSWIVGLVVAAVLALAAIGVCALVEKHVA